MDIGMIDAMLASAAEVLGTLVDRAVTATAATPPETIETSIRIDPDSVATLTEVPAGDFRFVTRYRKSGLANIVELMLGSPAGEGEMDAMQLSIVAETVSQISSAMAEVLTQSLGIASQNIRSEVPTEAGAFPVPPFASYAAELDVAGEFRIGLSIDFDGVARAKIAPPPAEAAPEPVAERVAAQPAASAQPTASAQPAAFAPMAPTLIKTGPPGTANLELVHDIPMEVSAVLGHTALSLRDVVALQNGSVLELDKLSTDPIDLYVNKILIARGEVVVVDEKFAVKISELNPEVDRV